MGAQSPDTAAETGRWVTRARLDLDNAKALYETLPAAYDNVAFLCQQAVEKLVKAFLVAHATPFPKTHDIRTLLVGHVAEIEPELALEARFADELTPYVVASRYPEGSAMVTRECAEELIALMDRAWALFEPRILEILECEETADDPGASEDVDDG